MVKLTKEQIAEIIKLYSEGKTSIELAKMFNVSQPTILYHVNPKIKSRAIQISNVKYKSLSPEEKQVRRLKRKEYFTAYMRNRYKNNEEFRNKHKERVKGVKENDTSACAWKNKK